VGISIGRREKKEVFLRETKGKDGTKRYQRRRQGGEMNLYITSWGAERA